MSSNGHNPKHRDDGAGREFRELERRSTCGKRVLSTHAGYDLWWCILDPDHECRDGSACRGPHDPEPLDRSEQVELGGEG